MLRNQYQDLNQTHKDGCRNGKEKDTRRKEKKEEIKLRVLVQ